MSILEEINASAGNDVIIRTLELNCSAWDGPELISNGFQDWSVKAEDGRALTFQGANIDIALAKKDNKGNQTLAFAVDNTTGQVSQRLDAAMAARARVSATYRTYLKSNLNAPAEPPYRLTVLSGSIQGVVAQIQCGYFNMIDVQWPRALYTADYAPSLRYL